MLAENPIAKFEFAALQRTLGAKRPGYWLRLIFYFGILLVASLPLFIYLDDRQFSLLILMLFIVFSAQIILTLTTIMQACERSLFQRQAGVWDLLLLTGVSARNIIQGKQQAIVKAVWSEWIILGLVRFGAAFGLAQYFSLGNAFICNDRFPDTFCYQGFPAPTPSIFEICIAFFVILLMTRLELRLVILISICSSLLPTKNRTIAWIVASFVWLTITLGAITGTIFFDVVQEWVWAHSYADCDTSRVCALVSWNRAGELSGSESYQKWQRDSSFRRILQEVEWAAKVMQAGLSAISDAGTFLSAHIMRPELFPSLMHMLQCLISFITAVSLYHLLYRLVFKISEVLAVSQGALPEAHKRIKINKLYWLKRITGFA